MLSLEMLALQAKVMLKLNKAPAYALGLRLGQLDGYERLIAGIYGTPRPRARYRPALHYAMGMHGLSARTFFREPRPFIHASSNFARHFGIDFWSPAFDFYNIEPEALG